jgi:hypothetical protein
MEGRRTEEAGKKRVKGRGRGRVGGSGQEGDMGGGGGRMWTVLSMLNF